MSIAGGFQAAGLNGSLFRIGRNSGLSIPPLGRILNLQITERNSTESRCDVLPNAFEDYAYLASDWFWQMDADLRCTTLSGHFEAMTGRPASACLGRRTSDLAANAHDREFWQAHEEDLARRRPFRGFQHPVDHQGGRRLWLRISGDPVSARTARYGLSRYRDRRDCGARRARSASLEQKQRLDAAVAHLPHGLVMTDAVERVGLCNDPFLKLFGLSSSIVHLGLKTPELIAYGVAADNFPGQPQAAR